jgi:hypothetical protein
MPVSGEHLRNSTAHLPSPNNQNAHSRTYAFCSQTTCITGRRTTIVPKAPRARPP